MPPSSPAGVKDEPDDEQAAPPKAIRHRLPEERLSITHKFSVGGHEGYLTVGLYKDGMPGEIFITMAKEGSTVSGLMDSFACAVSIGLQHGVPLKLLCEKFAHTRFEPSGWSGNQDIGYAKSIMDYIFRWLQLRFLTGQQQALFDGLRPKYFGAPPSAPPKAHRRPEIVWRLRRQGSGLRLRCVHPEPQARDLQLVCHRFLLVCHHEAKPRDLLFFHGYVHASDALKELIDMGDAPTCSTCGAIMTRNGSCYRCMSCGSTSGCS